jgi:hypothetical protein
MLKEIVASTKINGTYIELAHVVDQWRIIYTKGSGNAYEYFNDFEEAVNRYSQLIKEA